MAFLVIMVLSVIVTGILESRFVEERMEKAEINSMADWSNKNPVAIKTRRCVYAKAYKPVLKNEVAKK